MKGILFATLFCVLSYIAIAFITWNIYWAASCYWAWRLIYLSICIPNVISIYDEFIND